MQLHTALFSVSAFKWKSVSYHQDKNEIVLFNSQLQLKDGVWLFQRVLLDNTSFA